MHSSSSKMVVSVPFVWVNGEHAVFDYYNTNQNIHTLLKLRSITQYDGIYYAFIFRKTKFREYQMKIR